MTLNDNITFIFLIFLIMPKNGFPMPTAKKTVEKPILDS